MQTYLQNSLATARQYETVFEVSDYNVLVCFPVSLLTVLGAEEYQLVGITDNLSFSPVIAVLASSAARQSLLNVPDAAAMA